MNDALWPLSIRSLTMFALTNSAWNPNRERVSFSVESAEVIDTLPRRWSDRIYRTIIEPIDFDLDKGQLLFIVGESGIGKSLLAKALLGLCEPQGPGLFTIGERVLCAVKKTPYMHPEDHIAWSRSTGIIFQEPSSYLNPVLSVGHQVYECGQKHTALEEIEMFIQNDLSVPRRRSFFHMYPADLSEGQKQRVLIGMNIIRPKLRLLIADEPTSALDPVTRNHVISLIAEHFIATRCSIIFVTHDPVLIQRLANETGVLDDTQTQSAKVMRLYGKPPKMDMMTVEDYLEYAERRLVHTSSQTTYPLWTAPRAYHGYLASMSHTWASNGDITAEIPDLDVSERWRFISRRCIQDGYSLRDYETDPGLNVLHRTSPLLHIPDLDFFYGPRFASPGVSIRGNGITVADGEIVGLLGESGTGKTTLMKCIGGLMTDVNGVVSLYDSSNRKHIDLLRASYKKLRGVRRQLMQIVFQNPDSALDPNMTMMEILDEVREIGMEHPADHYVDWLLARLYLSPRLCRAAQAYLSGGERYRFSLIRSLLLKPRLLVADEPFAAIDYVTREALVALFYELARGEAHQTVSHRMGFLIISHNLEAMMKICHRIYILARPIDHTGNPAKYAELVWGGHPLEAYEALAPVEERYWNLKHLRQMTMPDVEARQSTMQPPLKIDDLLFYDGS